MKTGQIFNKWTFLTIDFEPTAIDVLGIVI